MSAPDLASPIRDFFQTGGPYWLGGAHLAVIYSPGEVAIRMNIWEFFTPWTTLSNCLSANDLSAVLKPLSRKCRKLWRDEDDCHVHINKYWLVRVDVSSTNNRSNAPICKGPLRRTRCDNAINGDIRTLYISILSSHFCVTGAVQLRGRWRYL